jgi:hypothetical protein
VRRRSDPFPVPAGTFVAVPLAVFTSRAKSPVVLLKMIQSFEAFGTMMVASLASAPVTSMNRLRACACVSVVVPPVVEIAWRPQIASSIMSKLVLSSVAPGVAVRRRPSV